MSWLTKVTDIAGRAEDFLNRIDQNTADVSALSINVLSFKVALNVGREWPSFP